MKSAGVVDRQPWSMAEGAQFEFLKGTASLVIGVDVVYYQAQPMLVYLLPTGARFGFVQYFHQTRAHCQ